MDHNYGGVRGQHTWSITSPQTHTIVRFGNIANRRVGLKSHGSDTILATTAQIEGTANEDVNRTSRADVRKRHQDESLAICAYPECVHPVWTGNLYSIGRDCLPHPACLPIPWLSFVFCNLPALVMRSRSSIDQCRETVVTKGWLVWD